MATFTLTQNTNIDALTGRTGGDIVDTNGFDFTIDQDTRFGVGGSATASFAAITANATKGGGIFITTMAVRHIPYTGGSGTVPAYNTTISRGGASGRLIGVMSSITATPTAPGAAMPASGWIKIKAWNQVAFTAGALTGITATASGPDVQGVIDVVGDVGATLTANRQGGFYCTGGMFDVGVTTGISASTYQLPTLGNSQHFAGVQVETAVGSNEFDWCPKIGDANIGTIATDAVRGKYCYITTAGVLRLGHNGTAASGFTPPAGLRIRCASILLNSCATASRGTNAVPGTAPAARYQAALTTAPVTIIGTNSAWWVSFNSTGATTVINSSFCDTFALLRVRAELRLDNFCVGVGSSITPTTNNGSASLQDISTPNVINKFTAMCWSSGAALSRISDTKFKDLSIAIAQPRTTQRQALNTGSSSNVEVDGFTLGGGNVALQGYSNFAIKNMVYWANQTDTVSTFTENIFEISAVNCTNFSIDGFRFAVPTASNNGFIVNNSQSSQLTPSGLTFKNFGTATAPLLSSPTVPTRGIVFSTNFGYAKNFKFQRCYVPNFVNGLASISSNNLGAGLEIINCSQSDSLATDFFLPLATNVRAFRSGRTDFALPYYIGNVFSDNFNSDTAGALVLSMNDVSDFIAPFVSLSGGAGFTGASPASINMTTVGQTATFEWPWRILGHTGFANSAVTSSIALTPFTFAYQIDTGAGYTNWSAELTAAQMGAALNALGAINSVTGFKFKLRITTATANATPIPFIRVITTTSAVAQSTGLHPLSVNTININSLAPNTRIKAEKASDGAVLFSGATPGTSISFTTEFSGDIKITARNATGDPAYQEWVTVVTPIVDGTVNVTALQVLDQ